MAVWINLCLMSITGVLMLRGVLPLPDGAPPAACSTMMPNHTSITHPSELPAPFTISVSSDTFQIGRPVKVTVRVKENELKFFQGFMIQARRADRGSDDNTPVGTFQTIPGTKHICRQNALTHSRKLNWSEVAVDWMPSSFARSVQFRVTVVKAFETYWVDERSAIIYDHRFTPAPTQPPTTLRPFILDVTDGCGKTKGCYRNPAGCSEQSCDIVVTWQKRDSHSYEFAMSADTDGWVALGLSEDKFMGDDDVVECIWNENNKTVDVRFSKNDGKMNKVTNRRQSELGRLSDIEWNHNKGQLRCQFVIYVPRSPRDKSSLAKASPRHLFMAKGKMENGKKLRHSLEPNKYPYVSPSVVSMNDKDDISDTARYPLVKAHGCLMLIAWMMCASTALILSKYYKRMWPNDKLCGVEVWFAVHRALMIVCLILTAIAFILIFVHVGGYSHMPDYPDKAHPPLGICVMILVILNPFITLFRCNPKSKYRPIFNWFHWLFGTVAYVLQLPAIFIGLNLHKAFVPSWATWIMTAFILFHLIIELLLEIHGCLNARKQKRRDDDFERTKKTDFKGEYQGLKEEPVGHRFKKIVLSLYLVVVIILGIILVLAVAAG